MGVPCSQQVKSLAEEEEEATWGKSDGHGSEDNITEEVSEETEQHVTQDSGTGPGAHSSSHSTRKSLMDNLRSMVGSSTAVEHHSSPYKHPPDPKPSFMRRKIRRACVSDFQGSNS